MLNIVDLLEKRRKYKFDINHHDAWIEEVCKDKVKKTLYIIVPVNFLIANPLLKRFNEKYSIDGVFEIGNPFIDYTKYFCSVLVIAHSKENSKKDFKIGIFNNKCTNHVVDSCYDRDLTRICQDDFTDTFKSYINIVREWVESNKKPSDFDSNNYEFNSFPQIYVDKKHLYPKYYANNCVNVRNISLNHVEQLNNVATILIPKYDGEVNVFYKLLRISRFTYPLELNCIEEINPTNRINVSNITLKKGDIVLSKSLSDDLPVLFDLDEDNIRASVESLVIRCHSIPPEYLYLYFRSKI